MRRRDPKPQKYHPVEMTHYQCKVAFEALSLYSVYRGETKTIRDLGIMFMTLADDR